MNGKRFSHHMKIPPHIMVSEIVGKTLAKSTQTTGYRADWVLWWEEFLSTLNYANNSYNGGPSFQDPAFSATIHALPFPYLACTIVFVSQEHVTSNLNGYPILHSNGYEDR
jgi:hypothetical protein